MERRSTRLVRRTLTLPGLLLLACLVFAALPLLLPAAALIDIWERRRARFLRFSALLLLYPAAEIAGLLGAGAAWILKPLLGRERYLAANFSLQRAWAGALLRLGLGILAIRIRFVAEARPRPERPLIVFARHLSMVDSLLPNTLVAARYDMRLRYVIKHELRFDPCLDIVGGRLPVYFVRRGAADPAEEAARVGLLAATLGAGDAVLLFPEGTRGGAAGRRRTLARLKERGDAQRLAFAKRLTHLLPPRSRGPLALLEAAPQADVLFLCHRGLEGAVSFAELASGRLIGRTLQVHTRRVDAEAVPRAPAAQRAWLDAEWERMDREITRMAEEETSDG